MPPYSLWQIVHQDTIAMQCIGLLVLGIYPSMQELLVDKESQTDCKKTRCSVTRLVSDRVLLLHHNIVSELLLPSHLLEQCLFASALKWRFHLHRCNLIQYSVEYDWIQVLL